MPTIKTKKEMNLPQLIEWGWKNIEKVENKIFKSNTKDVFGRYSTVYFSVDGYGFNTEGVSHKDTFTVEVEEEITEDTVIPKMVSIGRENQNETNVHYSVRIGQFLDNEDFNYYVLNDDDTLTLIWRDGKLVE